MDTNTDFADFYLQEEGCVLSSAIDKFVFVIVKERFDQMIRVGYTRTELVENVQDLQHDLVREALKISGVESQIEIGTLADIPSSGSGLGSSTPCRSAYSMRCILTATNQCRMRCLPARHAR